MNDIEMLEQTMVPSPQVDLTMKEKLTECIIFGRSKTFLGKEIKVEDLDKLSPLEIEKLYVTYKSRLASAMTKSLGDSIIRAYSHIACMALKYKGQKKNL